MKDDATPIRAKLVDSFYCEAMLLADEARSYFDMHGRDERDCLGPMARVVFSCESLKVTTRLMHIIAWLLTQRAVANGELRREDAIDPARRLGTAPATESTAIEGLPAGARDIILASIDLHRRVARLDAAQTEPPSLAGSPARSMMERLSHAF